MAVRLNVFAFAEKQGFLCVGPGRQKLVFTEIFQNPRAPQGGGAPPEIRIESPRDGNVIGVEPGGGRVLVNVTASVTDPNGDLRSADLVYIDATGSQGVGDSFGLQGKGGTGKASVALPGKGKYRLEVHATDEAGGTARQSVSIEIRELDQAAFKQLSGLKQVLEAQRKALEEIKKKSEGAKNSPTLSRQLEEELRIMDNNMKELRSGIKTLKEEAEKEEDKELQKMIDQAWGAGFDQEIEKIYREASLTKGAIAAARGAGETTVSQVTLGDVIGKAVETASNQTKVITLTPAETQEYFGRQPADQEIRIVLGANGSLESCSIEEVPDKRNLVVKLKDGIVGLFREVTGRATEPADGQQIVIVLKDDLAKVTSGHTKFEAVHDSYSGVTNVTVFEGDVDVKSLKSVGAEVTLRAGERVQVTEKGLSSIRKFNRSELMIVAEKYAPAFGGKNPLAISEKEASPPAAVKTAQTLTFTGVDKAQAGEGEIAFKDVDVYEYSYMNWNNANWGAAPNATLSSYAGGLPDTRRRIYIGFDTKALAALVPDPGKVELQLSHWPYNQVGSISVKVFRVLEPWEEGEGLYRSGENDPGAPPGMISWSGQPRWDGETVWATKAVSAGDKPFPVRWDITGLVKGWLSGKFPNHGLVLVGEGEGSASYSHTFCSSENTDEAMRPKIVVTAPGR
jgi:hypothetical protein